MSEGALTLDQGIQALLNGGQQAPDQEAPENQDPPESAAGVEHDADESQSDASFEDAQSGLSQESPESASSEDDAPDGGEPDSEETSEETQEVSDDDPVFAFKADGADVEMKASELIREYQSRQGLDKVRSEVDRQKSELERDRAEVSQRLTALQAERERYIGEIDAARKVLGEASEIKYPDPLLQQTDPMEYTRLLGEAVRQRQELQEIEDKRQREFDQWQATAVEQQNDRIAEENAKLLQKVPEWQDPAVRQREEGAMWQYAMNDLGYTQEEVKHAIDHRAYVAVREAWLRKTEKAGVKKVVAKKVAAATPTIRSGQRVKTKSKTDVQKADDAFVDANRRAAAGDPGADVLGQAIRLVVQKQNARAQQ